MDNEQREPIDLSQLARKLPKRKKINLEGKPILLPGTPKIIRWIVIHSKGLVKNEKEATYLLFIVLFFILAIAIFFLGLSLKKPFIPPEALEIPEKGLPIND